MTTIYMPTGTPIGTISDKDVLSGLRSVVIGAVGAAGQLPLPGASVIGKGLAAIIGFLWKDPKEEDPLTPQQIFAAMRSQISELISIQVEEKLKAAKTADIKEILGGIREAVRVVRGAKGKELKAKLPAFTLDLLEFEPKFTALPEVIGQSADTLAMLVTFGSIVLLALRQELDLVDDLYDDMPEERKEELQAMLGQKIAKYVDAFRTCYLGILEHRYSQIIYFERETSEPQPFRYYHQCHHEARDNVTGWKTADYAFHHDWITQGLSNKKSISEAQYWADHAEQRELAYKVLSVKRTEVMKQLVRDLEPLRQTVYMWSFLDPMAPSLDPKAPRPLFSEYYLDLPADTPFKSPSGEFSLHMQSDHNVVIYQHGAGGPVFFASGTNRDIDTSCRLLVGSDANLIAAAGTPPAGFWSLNSAPLGPPPYRCVMRDDGIFMIRALTDNLIAAIGNVASDPGLHSWDNRGEFWNPGHPEFIGRFWVPFSDKKRMVECLQGALYATPEQAAELLNGSLERQQAALGAVRATLEAQRAPVDIVRMVDNLAALLA